MTAIRPEHRVVLIKIARSAPADGEPAALFEATSKWWVVAKARRGAGPASPEYAVAVSRGRVVVAYRITGWVPAPRGGRWGFTGRVSEELTALYAGMDVTGYFPPGAANPLRYVNCAERDPGEGPAGDPQPPVPEVKEQELAETVRRIDAEPLAHLMLGHRELFHSNLLAWFFQRLPEQADRVFMSLAPPWSGDRTRRREVRREHKNLDLYLRWPGRVPLVIENKVFSLPDEAQLAEYGTRMAADGDQAALWLLSLSDPSWVDDRKDLAGQEWHWLSYRDLADRIRTAVPPGDASYEAETMHRYAGLVDLLSDLADRVIVADPDETVDMPADVQAALGDGRLSSAMGKLRARSVAQQVEAALKDAGVADPTIEAGLTRAKPLVSWYGRLASEPRARAGWQLQEKQFRLAIIAEHLRGRDPEQRDLRVAFARKHENLFDFGVVDDILGTRGMPVVPGPDATGQHGFRRFDPDFLYRYKRVDRITVAQLAQVAVALARRARV